MLLTANGNSAIPPASCRSLLLRVLTYTHGPGGVRHTEGSLPHADRTMTVPFPGAGHGPADHGRGDGTQLGKTIAFGQGRLDAGMAPRFGHCQNDQRAACRTAKADKDSLDD